MTTQAKTTSKNEVLSIRAPGEIRRMLDTMEAAYGMSATQVIMLAITREYDALVYLGIDDRFIAEATPEKV
jgi:uncharacterized membrane protein